MTRWLQIPVAAVAWLSACELPQSSEQAEQLVALGGDPERYVVYYKCWDTDAAGAPRATPHRRAEQCYLKQQEGFAVMRWDRSGRLERVERAWDFGQDTTANARRRWTHLRDSLVTAVSKARAATSCTAPTESATWFRLWGWRLPHADLLVLSVADPGLAIGLTASAVRLSTCWAAKRPAA